MIVCFDSSILYRNQILINIHRVYQVLFEKRSRFILKVHQITTIYVFLGCFRSPTSRKYHDIHHLLQFRWRGTQTQQYHWSRTASSETSPAPHRQGFVIGIRRERQEYVPQADAHPARRTLRNRGTSRLPACDILERCEGRARDVSGPLPSSNTLAWLANSGLCWQITDVRLARSTRPTDLLEPD